jgi:hypothetical protein
MQTNKDFLRVDCVECLVGRLRAGTLLHQKMIHGGKLSAASLRHNNAVEYDSSD